MDDIWLKRFFLKLKISAEKSKAPTHQSGDEVTDS